MNKLLYLFKIFFFCMNKLLQVTFSGFATFVILSISYSIPDKNGLILLIVGSVEI